MTVPIGPAGINAGIFGVTSGDLGGLVHRTEDAVRAILEAEILAMSAWNQAAGLVWAGLERGLSLPMAIIKAIIGRLFDIADDIPGIHEALAAIKRVPGMEELTYALTGTGDGHDLTHLGEFMRDRWSQLGGILYQIEQLILQVVGAASIGDVAQLINVGKASIDLLVVTATGGGGSGFPWTFPTSFGTGSGFPWAFPVQFGSVEKTIEDVGQAIFDAPKHAQEVVNAFVQTIQGIPAGIDHSLTDLQTALQQLPSSPVLAEVQSGLDGAVATAGQVESIIVNAGVETATQAGEALYGAAWGAVNSLSQIDDVVVNVIGGVAPAITSFGAAIGSFFAGLFNPWAPAPVNQASAYQASQAAQAAAAAAAFQAAQTAAINAQLPHLYGGSGTSGNSVAETLSGALPGTMSLASTIAATSALYTATAAVTDEQSVSAIWSGGLTADTYRYLFLRSNTAATTYVYAKWGLAGDPGAVYTDGTYWVDPYNPAAYFVFELGCVVAGVKTVLSSWNYPLWIYNNSGSGHNFYRAGTGLYFYLAAVNNVISFSATDYALELEYPYDPPILYTDASHVSQKGASYRYGGFGATGGAFPGNAIRFGFYDSGPTSGPATATVATTESTTSTVYVNLATATDSVVVNIGQSGLAIVMIYTVAINPTAAQYAAMGYGITGATTRAATDDRAIALQTATNGGTNRISGTFLESGLTPGATTFQAKYRATSSTASFGDRRISVIPL